MTRSGCCLKVKGVAEPVCRPWCVPEVVPAAYEAHESEVEDGEGVGHVERPIGVGQLRGLGEEVHAVGPETHAAQVEVATTATPLASTV